MSCRRPCVPLPMPLQGQYSCPSRAVQLPAKMPGPSWPAASRGSGGAPGDHDVDGVVLAGGHYEDGDHGDHCPHRRLDGQPAAVHTIHVRPCSGTWIQQQDARHSLTTASPWLAVQNGARVCCPEVFVLQNAFSALGISTVIYLQNLSPINKYTTLLLMPSMGSRPHL